MLHTKRPSNSAKEILYRGRFAPSPSGFLHFGSLVAALASYLDAKAFISANGKQGKWLVRIEDIDPPRELSGASTAILTTLDAFGLHWDETELYQSQQSKHYTEVLNHLRQQSLSYYCQCTRADIKAMGGIYQGHCRHVNKLANNNAIRLINQQGIYHFHDLFQGKVNCDKALAKEDFIIHRKDGLFAYQLAVVVDDISQNISHVIRGCDLLEPTARQLTFFNTLKKPVPQYGHVPLAVTPEGYKLSKQNKAPAIDNNKPQPALIAALIFLGQKPPRELISSTVEEVIQWSVKNWHRGNVPTTTQVMV
ncbi:MAG: tRNA glutamyl-Q(34) synthetase GluQRS [Colwellia sp.]